MSAISLIKDMAGNIAAFLAAFGTLVGCVDYFLAKRQKDFITNTNLRIWYWLADRSAARKIALLRTEYMFRFTSLQTPLVLAWLALFANILLGDFYGIITNSIAIVLYIYLLSLPKESFIISSLYDFWKRMLSSDNPVILFFRLISFWLLGVAILGAALFIMYIFRENILAQYAMAAYFMFMYFIGLNIFSTIFRATALYISVLFIAFFFGLYRVLELLARKVAESEKGAVFGFSALLGTLAAALKSIA
ncbi:hypothetical protein HFN62_11625 [Rhizobium leguminosarum]|uniref:hypothetical protein n=1 Tax=Rhizobium leguminosarum TaxID=384 RepID=UPI001C97FEAD|nr:hypothetical protein [Rhizobium leguminosarum]MBY5784388.1 hypothetical protein [Rhizobium leguminosarum]